MQVLRYALRLRRSRLAQLALFRSNRRWLATQSFCDSGSSGTQAAPRWPRGAVAAAAMGLLTGTCLTLGTFLRPDQEQDGLEQKLLERGTHDSTLPSPGSLLQLDYRSPETKAHASQLDGSARIVQWNIERGYKLDEVIAELAELNADVLLLQEIDVNCDRSDNRDTGGEIAAALGLNYVLLCEFVELRSKSRDAASQGGGIHGNAIMTKFDFLQVEAIEHEYHPIDWNSDAHSLSRREPREGSRQTLAASVATPAGPVQLYSAHLEVFCGPLGRLRQFADILRHSRAAAENGVEKQVIGGDLNTMGHGVARLSPFHCTDRMRWASLGQDEAHWWQQNLFDVHADHEDVVQGINTRLRKAGLDDDEACAALINPGFEEVFTLDEDTLDNPNYRFFGFPLMHGKLDWLLYRGLGGVKTCRIGNDDYAASDHKWLCADLALQPLHKDDGLGTDSGAHGVPSPRIAVRPVPVGSIGAVAAASKASVSTCFVSEASSPATSSDQSAHAGSGAARHRYVSQDQGPLQSSRADDSKAWPTGHTPGRTLS